MFYKLIKKLTNYLSTDIPPGPKFLKLKHVINLQKGGTFLYVLALMNYFKNYNKTAYLYLSLHGTYGLIWLLKDRVIPDIGWERKTTILINLSIRLAFLSKIFSKKEVKKLFRSCQLAKVYSVFSGV